MSDQSFRRMVARKIRARRRRRVALMMPNVLQYPIALFGTLRAGMTVVNTNPLYTARELEHQLKIPERNVSSSSRISRTCCSKCCRARP